MKPISRNAAAELEESPSADALALCFFAVTVALSLAAVPLTDPLSQIFITILLFLCFLCLYINTLFAWPRRDISFYLFLPLLISAVQNVYLGLVAQQAFALQLQLAIGLNVFLGFAFTFLLLAQTRSTFAVDPLAGLAALIAATLMVYGIATWFAFKGAALPALSSLRNILSPALFLLFGLLAARRVSVDRFFAYVCGLGWLIIAFGVLERVFLPDLWRDLNIAVLWPKKGIPNITFWGLPSNFVSSELINGEHVRRMVSLYGDPVNFGAVLFLIMMVAWYTRRYALMIAALVCIVAAISKGGLQGVLVFASVWGLVNLRGPMLALLLMAVLALGVGFATYSYFSSTQSLFIHLSGLWSALRELPGHPLGQGLGNVGVLAQEGSETKESGLGLVIGQLGIVGLASYAIFMLAIFARARYVQPTRERVFSLSLLCAVALNVAFNEVALSPNSSAGYFIVLGLACAKWGNRAPRPGLAAARNSLAVGRTGPTTA